MNNTKKSNHPIMKILLTSTLFIGVAALIKKSLMDNNESFKLVKPKIKKA